MSDRNQFNAAAPEQKDVLVAAAEVVRRKRLEEVENLLLFAAGSGECLLKVCIVIF